MPTNKWDTTKLSQCSILAIDPGKMTGLAYYRAEQFTAAEFDFMETAAMIEDLTPHCDLVVIERFTIGVATGKKNDVNWPLELIGITRYMTGKSDVPIVFQGPAEAKNFCPDDRLKALGWYKSTNGGHANDATRHLVTALVNVGWWNSALIL